jgi:GT2 family glycosyltransferase
LKIAVIIPNYNGENFIGACLDSLLEQTRPADEVIVVDNGSVDSSFDVCTKHGLSPVLVKLDHNLGFSKAVNSGIEKTDADIIALLNNDTVADPDWIANGLSTFEKYPMVSMIASLMLRLDDRMTVDSAGDLYPVDARPIPRGSGSNKNEHTERMEVLTPCAGAAFYKKDVFSDTGGFEDSFFAYLEDVDLGLRARALGHICQFVPDAIVYHAGAGTDLGDIHSEKNVDSSERVRLIARNRVRVISRNWPLPRILKWGPFILFGLFRSFSYHLLISRQILPFMKGVFEGVLFCAKDRKSFRKLEDEVGKNMLSEVGHMMETGAIKWDR